MYIYILYIRYRLLSNCFVTSLTLVHVRIRQEVMIDRLMLLAFFSTVNQIIFERRTSMLYKLAQYLVNNYGVVKNLTDFGLKGVKKICRHEG